MTEERLPNVRGTVVRWSRENNQFILVLETRHVLSKTDGWNHGDTVEMKIVTVNGRPVIE